MFQKTKNIDAAFRHIRLFTLVFIIASVITSVFIAYKSFQLSSKSQQKIFILANGKALEAYSADRKDNIPVEARDHVKMFHHFFADAGASQGYFKEGNGNGYMKEKLSGKG
jgi:hypothetical protein